MNANGELGLKLPAPEVAPDEVRNLIVCLREEGGWMTAGELAEMMGDGASDRHVRKLAIRGIPPC